MSYNGYSNYETWNVCLWLNNDEGLYNETLSIMRHSSNEAKDLKEFVHELFLANEGKFGDLDSIDEIAKVDWDEIVEAMQEDIA